MTELNPDWTGLPGADLITRGLQELAAEKTTEHSLLVLVGEPRLRALDVPYPAYRPDLSGPAEHALYDLLVVSAGSDAYGRYNSMLRRMNSFAHALEREKSKSEAHRKTH